MREGSSHSFFLRVASRAVQPPVRIFGSVSAPLDLLVSFSILLSRRVPWNYSHHTGNPAFRRYFTEHPATCRFTRTRALHSREQKLLPVGCSAPAGCATASCILCTITSLPPEVRPKSETTGIAINLTPFFAQLLITQNIRNSTSVTNASRQTAKRVSVQRWPHIVGRPPLVLVPFLQHSFIAEPRCARMAAHTSILALVLVARSENRLKPSKTKGGRERPTFLAFPDRSQGCQHTRPNRTNSSSQ